MKIDLQAMLPAGEWAHLQVLNQTPGMMAGKNWAVFAKATRIRDGGKRAFIKFIVSAGSHAGDTTLLVTSRDRLGDLFGRLRRIQQMGDAVPIVSLLEIKHSDAGLLIAMEEVTPLINRIDRGEAYHLSTRVLSDLDPDASANGWHHFDVCPNNIGVREDGQCVLIDVESFYLESNGGYNVSVPAWKPFRTPSGLERDVQVQLAAGEFDRQLGTRKLRFEIALAAAECVLGPLLSSGNNLDKQGVEAWVANADGTDPAVIFWKQELLQAVDTGSFPPLHELRARLEAAIGSESEPTGAPLVQVPPIETGTMPEFSSADPMFPPIAAQSGWLNEWALVLPMVHALRAGKLGGKQIVDYRVVLQQLASRYPTEATVWNELLLVVISYEKNPLLAAAVVDEALRHIPNSEDLVRMRDIVRMWARGRQNGL